jgi:ring-1,2-phenylacetyl-CoA epoxidase subunit PaaE
MSVQLRVTAVNRTVNDIVIISFETLNGEVFPYQAGQFLTLVFEVNGKEHRRSYSFCSSPAVNEPITIAVKLVENGEISRFIHHQITIGDVVQATHANGLFVYRPKAEKQRTIFLFGAGVGITPLFSILKTALTDEESSKVVLIYSSRSKADALFFEALTVWQHQYPNRFKLINLFSNAKNLMRARLNGLLICQLVKEELQFDKADALFYTCGPVDYMDVCKFTLLGMGFSPTQVKRETFVLPEDEVDEDDATKKKVDKNTYSVILNFKGETYHLDIPYQKRILEVALAHKIKLPYSCSGGVCSTCVANCIKGGVRMDYNEVLTDEEIAKGRVLVCTAHPTANGTTISWD